MRGRAIAALFLAGALCQAAVPARAGPASDAHTDSEGIETHIRNDYDSGFSPGKQAERKAETPMLCEFSELSPENVEAADRMARNGLGPARGPEPGHWVQRVCHLQNGSGSVGEVVWVRDAVDIEALAEEARDRLPLPAPAVRMSPPADRPQIVNGPSTWLAIDPSMWRPLSSALSSAGVTVTARAQPMRVRWDMGAGDAPVVCSGPGSAYGAESEDTACSYVWPRPSRDQPGGKFRVTVTIEWRASWTVEGAAGGGDLGTVMRSSTLDVEVVERRAVNTRH